MAEQQEFKFAGMTMTAATIRYGLLLIFWGAVFSIGSQSFTSWIPALIGLPIFLAGVLAWFAPNQKRIWMHVAVLFGLAAFMGGFRFFAGMGTPGGLFGTPKAAASQLMLLLTGGVYTVTCIRSFIWVRRHEVRSNAV